MGKAHSASEFSAQDELGVSQPGESVEAGDEEELVGADYSVYDPALAKAFRQALRRLKIAIKYKSLYGDASELVFVGTEEIAHEP